MGFVEHRLGARDALYEADRASGLPGDTVRLRVNSDDSAPDVSERHHTVEFMSLTGDGHWKAVGCIGHSLKEIAALQGRYIELQSTFEIVGPGLPLGQFPHSEVEPVVQEQLDKLKAARLLPIASMGGSHEVEACAA